jgi:radical S-adenosyl methionine domain-containing protein 2
MIETSLKCGHQSFTRLAHSVPMTVNYHMLRECNARCRFCFAHFRESPTRLKVDESVRLTAMLAKAGARRMTFAGGEPTLHSGLGQCLAEARARGLETSVVSNGARLSELLDECGAALDWVTLSLESGDERVQASLGRGDGSHVRRVRELARRVKGLGIRLKINTVVTRLNVDEDLSLLMGELRPERWKLLQVLKIAGENDDEVGCLSISAQQFNTFVERHRGVAGDGIVVVPEDNEAMSGSYVMVDPMGRFVSNLRGRYFYSRRILDVGVEAAFEDVDFDVAKYVERGAVYA